MMLIVEHWLALSGPRKAVLLLALMAVCTGIGWLVWVMPVKQQVADSVMQLNMQRTQWQQQQANWLQLRQQVAELEQQYLCISQPVTVFSAQRFTRDVGGKLLRWGMPGGERKGELSLSLPWEGVLQLFPALAGEPVELPGFQLQADEGEQVSVRLDLEIMDASDNVVDVMGTCAGL
ncbi:hypothetical protein A9B99_08005 [Mangrovibacter phragmitis]|uniref:DNA utilization protein HofO C-terminal domain-containing protein n=1 Tax=Mangrovibacter phragmitis TaxID=1691903 RepID=A0A1B7L4N1_9ENTR|nr:hypothetical protein [Mangrovibacter phragmitis]OAT77236.1 hypothetical protein A9B99_08005 [Mangrovibacter phragmitis]